MSKVVVANNNTTKQQRCHTAEIVRLNHSMKTRQDHTAFPKTGHNDENRCGFTSGWRVPATRELLSIVHSGASTSPRIDSNYFPSTSTDRYWAAEEYAFENTNAWAVNFADGSAAFESKFLPRNVRLVQGAATPSASYVVNGDGTVTDPNTGLIWDRCVLGRLGGDCSAGSPITNPWNHALRDVRVRNQTRYLGYSDWRLPNRNELQSLVAINSTNAPVIDNVVFPNSPNDQLWSSTSYSTDPTRVWTVNFINGLVDRPMKTAGQPVRLVRGGQAFAAFNLVPGCTADFDGNGGDRRVRRFDPRAIGAGL